MSTNVRLALRSFAAILVIAISTAAFGKGVHDRTQFGHNISVGAGEEVSEVTCFGCSVRVRGHVASDVTTFGGSIVVEGQGEIGGDTTTFGGSVRLEKDAKVHDVTVFGGQVHRDADATVQGDVTNFGGAGWVVLIFGLPLVIFGAVIALIVWLVRRLIRPAVPVAA
jgi:hypothetical protein